MNHAASQEALLQMHENDDRVAKIYEGKVNAHKRQVQDFTRKLINIRNNCEQQSLTSLQRCDQIQEKIGDLENNEKQLFNDLSNTMK